LGGRDKPGHDERGWSEARQYYSASSA
jgi:hypothetical protein